MTDRFGVLWVLCAFYLLFSKVSASNISDEVMALSAGVCSSACGFQFMYIPPCPLHFVRLPSRIHTTTLPNPQSSFPTTCFRCTESGLGPLVRTWEFLCSSDLVDGVSGSFVFPPIHLSFLSHTSKSPLLLFVSARSRERPPLLRSMGGSYRVGADIGVWGSLLSIASAHFRPFLSYRCVPLLSRKHSLFEGCVTYVG